VTRGGCGLLPQVDDPVLSASAGPETGGAAGDMAASAARPASGLSGTRRRRIWRTVAAYGVEWAIEYVGRRNRKGLQVTSEDEGLDQPRDLRSRDHALSVLARVGIRGAQADELLSGIKFPAPLTEILAHLGKYGIDMDSMTDEMGGSP
jgi:hypothetical protein